MFDNIIGHEDKKNYFKNIIKEHNISHSYIFYGKEGIGKLTFAKQIAKQILNTDNLETCPDYKYIKKLDDKKDILIEQIRNDIIDNIYIAPITCDHKVYIIDDAEYLNISAQNSLLKTLEEPPEYVVIILICSNLNNILTTILSRANKINFSGIDKEDIINYCKTDLNISLPDKIINYADGSIGKIIKIINNNMITEFEKVDKFISCILDRNVIDAMNISENIDFNDQDIVQYLEYSLFILKKYSTIKIVERAILRLKNNGNYDIVKDNMILKIIDEI